MKAMLVGDESSLAATHHNMGGEIMKVLLVYPEFPDTFWSLREAIRFEGRRAAIPPLGLMTVSAMLPKEWERRLIDMNVRDLTPENLEWADLVFISAMRIQHDTMRQVIEQSKSAGKRDVLGGPYPSDSEDCAEVLDFFSTAVKVTQSLE